MKPLHAEILRRFPGVAEHISEYDATSAYMLMADLHFWLGTLSEEDFSQDLGAKLASLGEWCESPPPGAEQDGEHLFSIWVVGFLEALFLDEKTIKLVPKLVLREDFERNAEYLRRWVGDDRYEAAQRLYEGEASAKAPPEEP